MYTARQIIVTARKIAYGGQVTDDQKPGDRFVLDLVHGARSTLIRRDEDKGRPVGQAIEQKFNCQELETLPTYTCCGIESCTNIQRTVNEIPDFVEGVEGPLITYVGGTDGFSQIDLVKPHRIKYHSYAKYTANAVRAIYLDKRIYIINDPPREKLQIRGAIANPAQEGVTDMSDSNCIDLDARYPIYDWMFDTIVEMVAEKLIGTKQQTIDGTNNASGEDKTKVV